MFLFSCHMLTRCGMWTKLVRIRSDWLMLQSQWESGLKSVDEAIWYMPRSTHKWVDLLLHRYMDMCLVAICTAVLKLNTQFVHTSSHADWSLLKWEFQEESKIMLLLVFWDCLPSVIIWTTIVRLVGLSSCQHIVRLHKRMQEHQGHLAYSLSNFLKYLAHPWISFDTCKNLDAGCY